MVGKDGDKNMEEGKRHHFNSITEESSVLLSLKARLYFAFLTKTLCFSTILFPIDFLENQGRMMNVTGMNYLLVSKQILSEHMLCTRYHCRHEDRVEDKTKFLPSRNFHTRKEE